MNRTELSHPTPCYENRCECSGKTATCVRARLTYIPTLWANITELVFSDNILEHVTESSFTNITSLRLVRFSLTWNRIQTISSGAFSVLRHLEFLDLSGNSIPPDTLTVGLKGLRNSPLRVLTLKLMKLQRLPKDIFHEINNSRIEVIDLGFNFIPEFDQAIFSPLPFLKCLKMYTNSIVHLKWGFSKTMSYLSFTGNDGLTTIPSFCSGVKPLYPNLKNLLFNELGLRVLTPDNFTCLPRVELIDISNNPVKEIFTNTFSSPPSLQSVLASDLKDNVRVARYAFNNSRLTLIRMSTNSKRIDSGLFDGCHGLQYMDLSGNHFSYVTDSVMTRLFNDIHGIKHLDLKHSSLQYFPSVIHTQLHNLEILIISANNIATLPHNLFQNLTYLTRFDASMLQITETEEETFPENVTNQLHDVSFAGNPFACVCEMRWFIQWLRREPHKFRGYFRSYTCSSPPENAGRYLVKVYISNQPCLLQRNTYIIFVAALIPVLLTIVVCSIVYRWRWHIRYIIFLLKYQGHHRRPAGNRLPFDAFVVYSPEDTRWITQHMLPQLEEEKGFKLCIHERDFDVGGAIVDNIVESVEASRKVLILISRNSLQSDWCQFEISFSHSRSLRARPGSLVIILKDVIESRFMTNSLRILLDMHRYISWPDDEEDLEARRLFWARVATEINREEN